MTEHSPRRISTAVPNTGPSQEGALAAYLWEEISDESPYRDPPGRFHRACSYPPRLHSAGLGAIENDVQGFRRSSGRLPDGGRGREHRQETRNRYQRPARCSDVRRDAAWRREGGD